MYELNSFVYNKDALSPLMILRTMLEKVGEQLGENKSTFKEFLLERKLRIDVLWYREARDILVGLHKYQWAKAQEHKAQEDKAQEDKAQEHKAQEDKAQVT
eukprot:GHVS01101766.1.p1 GENE.GHVS01101766.1~~GHVS01101766.1.p1  ORF type:complete len:101 (+),score=8.77 GHVS01101766.1:122-424(+)